MSELRSERLPDEINSYEWLTEWGPEWGSEWGNVVRAEVYVAAAIRKSGEKIETLASDRKMSDKLRKRYLHTLFPHPDQQQRDASKQGLYDLSAQARPVEEEAKQST